MQSEVMIIICKKPIFLFSLILFIAFSFVRCSNSNKVQQELEKYADRENKNYPQMIDDVTRLDSCKVLPSNRLQYHYTILLKNVALDTTMIKSALKETFIHSIKTDPGSAFLRERNVAFRYQYNDIANNYVFSVNVSPEDYK